MSYPVIGTLISPEMGTYMQRDESRDSIPIFSAKNEFGQATVFGWYYTTEVGNYYVFQVPVSSGYPRMLILMIK